MRQLGISIHRNFFSFLAGDAQDILAVPPYFLK